MDARSPLARVFLPRGYPHALSPDYLEYQLWTLPCHLFGHCSAGLATSSLFRALGHATDTPASAAAALGHPAAPAAAALAATASASAWLTREGLGALGRLTVGATTGDGRYDEDPRLWRMRAEALTTLGLALEIACQFVGVGGTGAGAAALLAAGGTLMRAAGRGVGRPCFRVVLVHLAGRGRGPGDAAAVSTVLSPKDGGVDDDGTSGDGLLDPVPAATAAVASRLAARANLGDVAAKEEAWEARQEAPRLNGWAERPRWPPPDAAPASSLYPSSSRLAPSHRWRARCRDCCRPSSSLPRWSPSAVQTTQCPSCHAGPRRRRSTWGVDGLR